MTYQSHQTKSFPINYLQWAIRVTRNHTQSQYIHSQHTTCPTKPNALPLYTFTALYLSHQTTRTPNIQIHSSISVPLNHTHSQYIHSHCPTSSTKPHTLPIYTFSLPYLSKKTTRNPNIQLALHFLFQQKTRTLNKYIPNSLSVTPNHKHSYYTHSQCHTCPTNPNALPIYKFTVPYLSHISTNTPTIYLQSALPVPPNHTLPLYNFTVPYQYNLSTRSPNIFLHSTLPVPQNHTH